MAASCSSSLSSLLPPPTTSHQPKISSCSSSPSSSVAFRFSHFSTPPSSSLSSLHKSLSISPLPLHRSLLQTNHTSNRPPIFHVLAEMNQCKGPLKVMISGAPASGKGTQCELIVKHHDLVHISAGDLLRAEVAAGTENGKNAKEYMTRGDLVPNEIVVNMVKERLSQPDVQKKGWLLDGYPRSQSQADAIEAYGIRPDVFILLEVPDDILIERVVGRRLDPVTGRIYHLKYSPPDSQEIAERLTQRFDDTEYQAKLRLQTHSKNVEAVIATYKDILKKIDGNRPKEAVFQNINDILSELWEDDSVLSASVS
eukprot:c32805_g1_i1 orf=123-1058(+)